MVVVKIRFGHLSDPRIHKTPDGYKADGVAGTFRTWLLAFEAMDDQQRRASLTGTKGGLAV